MPENVSKNQPVFRAANLDETSIRRSFPLVQLFQSDLQLEAWEAFTDSFRSPAIPQAGLKLIEDHRGYIHGVFSWRVGPSIRHGRLLRIADVVLAHLPGQTLLPTLLEDARQIGKLHRCNAILIELSERTRHLQGDLKSLGDTGFNEVSIGYLLASTGTRPAR